MKPHTPHYSVYRTEPTNNGGGTGTPKQRSNRRDSQPSERVLLKPLPGPRRAETRDKPEGSEPICSDATLQDGGNPYFEGSDKSEGLVGKSRSEGYLLCNPNPPVSPSISQVHFPRKVLSVPLPPIWPVISSLGLYQDLEASISPPSGDVSAIGSIYRRHSSPGRVQRTSKESCRGSSVPLSVPWFPDKPKEVSAGASTDNGIPGSDSGCCDHGIETSSRKDEKDSCGVTSYGKSRAGLSPSPATACGEDECNISGDPTSPTIIPPSTDGTVRHIKQKLAVPRGTGSHVSELQGGTDVVGQPYGELEWEIPPVEGGRYDNRLRRISDRMGCSMSEPTDRSSMVPGRMQDAYKLSGVIGCYTSSPHIPAEQNQDVSPPEVGQYHGSGLYQQPGRDGLQGIGRPSKKSMDVVFREKHSHYSSTPARCTKPDCRCGVSDGGGSVRLELRYVKDWDHENCAYALRPYV